MVKPVIVKRLVKGSHLTFTELDQNFQNLRDATINFTDGTQTLSIDLNDTVVIEGQADHNIQVTVDDTSSLDQTITIDNLVGDYTKEPMGFENRTDSTVSFNAGSRQFSIAPTTSSYRIWVQGRMFIKTTTLTSTIPNTSDLYYFYFDSAGLLQYGTSFNFGEHCPISAVQWNANTGNYYFLGEERHGVTMDWSTHQYLNETRGMQYASGFAATNYTTTGSGALDADAQLDLTDGVVYQEDIRISVSHSNTPTYSLFQQDIAGPGRFPVTYHSGSTGEWVKDSATDFPVKAGTARITYNLNTAGTWTTPDVGANQFVAYWLVATSNILDGPIVSVMGQRTDSNIGNAQDNNTFSELDLTNFPGAESRPLYRLIFQTGSYGNTVNARLVDIQDIRLDTVRATLGSTAAGLANVVEDLNPQLGGDLDVNGFSIVSISNGNIPITPNGTGSIILDGLSWPQTDGSANYVLKTNGSGQLSWVAQTVDTNTTYQLSAIQDGLDANIRLTGSDASTDDIQLEAGSNIALSVTSTGAIQIRTSADQSVNNLAATYNLTAGGYTQSSNQLYAFSSVGADGTQSGSTPHRGLGVSNATSGSRSVVYVRAHGQNESGGTSTTSGLAQLTLEGTRGTHTAPTALTTNNNFGLISAGGYDGAKYTVSDRGAGTAQIIFQADEPWANDGTYTTDAGTNVIMRIQPSNMRLTSNSRQNIFITDWDTAVTGSGPEQYILFGYPNSNTQYTNTGVQYTGTAKTNTQFINTALANIGVTGQDSAQFTADITGTTMTVTAVASGIISLGQRVYTNSDGTWGSVTQLTTITALGTGAGSTGTYTVSVSQTVASMTMYSGPDNHSLRNSNSIALVANRRNGLIGRRNKIKNNDIIHTIDFYGQTTNSSSGFGGKTATIGVTAVEDFETTAYGSEFRLETVQPTTTTMSTRLRFKSTDSTINTDSLTVENVAGTDILTLSTTAAELTSQSIDLTTTSTGNITLDINDQIFVNGRAGSPVIQSTNSSYPGLILQSQTDYISYIRIAGGQNGDITIFPNGTGNVNMLTDTLRLGDNGEDCAITTYGSYDLTLNTDSGTSSGSIKINAGANGNIEITPNGTGKIDLAGAIKTNATTGTPTNYENGYFEDMLATPVSWLKINVGGSDYYMPLFQ